MALIEPGPPLTYWRRLVPSVQCDKFDAEFFFLFHFMVVVDAWSACNITEWSSRLGCSFYSLLFMYICVSGEVAGLVGEGMVQTMARGSSCLSPYQQGDHSHLIISS